MKTNKSWLNYVGELRIPRQKDGESPEEYADRCKKTKVINTCKDFAVKKGSIIRLQKYEDYLKGRMDSGTMEQADFDKKMKRAEFVKYVLHVVPQNEEVTIKETKDWLNDAFEIRRKEDGTFYIKVKADFAVKKNSYINLKKVTESMRELMERGFITQEQYEDRINKFKIKDKDGNLTNNMWLIYTATIPPCK